MRSSTLLRSEAAHWPEPGPDARTPGCPAGTPAHSDTRYDREAGWE